MNRRIPRLRLVLLFSAVVAVGGVPARVAAQQSPLEGLDGYVRRVMHDWQAPGLAVAVVQGDRIVLAKGYGVREVGRDEPVDEHTLFAIASTTKAFTAAALGMLVDRGALHWDDRVIDYLERFRLFDPYATRELTVRDLLSHRSGLPRGDRLWYESPFDRDEVLFRVRWLEPQSSFRSRYGYQNIMVMAAGEVVEAVTDTTWDDFVRHRIFEPLGMRRTTTTVRDLERLGNVATPHGRIGGKVTPIAWPNFDNLGGAGAINSNAWDMAQWMRLQLGHGVYAGVRLLSDSVIEEMRTPQTVVRRSAEDAELFPESHFAAYGLGWRLLDYRGKLVVRHGGALDGMRTHVALVPEEDLGVVAITNINESRVPQAIVWWVIDQYLGPRDKDWNAVLLAAAERERDQAAEARKKIESERRQGTKPTHPLSEFAGSYTSELYGTAVVEESDGALIVRVGPHFVGDLEHWQTNTFRATWRNPYLGRAFVSFKLDRMGRVSGVDMAGFGLFTRDRAAAQN